MSDLNDLDLEMEPGVLCCRTTLTNVVTLEG